MKLVTVLCLPWIESERDELGVTQRFDGFSLHASQAGLDYYVKQQTKGRDGPVPSIYSFPAFGIVRHVQVPEAEAEMIKRRRGVRVYEAIPTAGQKVTSTKVLRCVWSKE